MNSDKRSLLSLPVGDRLFLTTGNRSLLTDNCQLITDKVVMKLADCYRLLGLNYGADLEQIKASYRRLARMYHPDVNPGVLDAEAKFVRLTEAYKLLVSIASRTPSTIKTPLVKPPRSTQTTPKVEVKPQGKPSPQPPPPSPPLPKVPSLSKAELELKWNSYQLLQVLLKNKRFARAIALVDGLGQRLCKDPEVRQWQAITYQQWGRQLLKEGELQKARIYFKKALRTDPHNRSLWAEIERDFRKMEELF
ncbi:J domain-containing protein [Oscillatoria salina]|uniref:J domain-containing protein n=1 Tax=Oscillatoria salina TaxID=331517 RepID=UPI002961FE6E|nr:DnaJ domain-containing protein [Oscillatoria salina]